MRSVQIRFASRAAVFEFLGSDLSFPTEALFSS